MSDKFEMGDIVRICSAESLTRFVGLRARIIGKVKGKDARYELSLLGPCKNIHTIGFIVKFEDIHLEKIVTEPKFKIGDVVTLIRPAYDDSAEKLVQVDKEYKILGIKSDVKNRFINPDKQVIYTLGDDKKVHKYLVAEECLELVNFDKIPSKFKVDDRVEVTEKTCCRYGCFGTVTTITTHVNVKIDGEDSVKAYVEDHLTLLRLDHKWSVGDIIRWNAPNNGKYTSKRSRITALKDPRVYTGILLDDVKGCKKAGSKVVMHEDYNEFVSHGENAKLAIGERAEALHHYDLSVETPEPAKCISINEHYPLIGGSMKNSKKMCPKCGHKDTEYSHLVIRYKNDVNMLEMTCPKCNAVTLLPADDENPTINSPSLLRRTGAHIARKVWGLTWRVGAAAGLVWAWKSGLLVQAYELF